MKNYLFIVILSVFVAVLQAQDIKRLPPPETEGGMPLMKALKNRQTSREFAETKLNDQQLSNLLWAADGVNRPETKKRTAPSAMNYQEIDIYITLSEGLYIYDADQHQITKVSGEDLRAKTGIQDFVANAPLTLVYVADYSKMSKSEDATRESYSMADAAFISQNVYLFCASENLNTGVRAYIDKEKLTKAMNLKPTQHIMLAQSVGFPKTK